MPSSAWAPLPRRPMYIPGRSRMCSSRAEGLDAGFGVLGCHGNSFLRLRPAAPVTSQFRRRHRLARESPFGSGWPRPRLTPMPATKAAVRSDGRMAAQRRPMRPPTPLKHGYVEADLKMKEACLDRLKQPAGRRPRRSEGSRLLSFLETI